MVGFSEIHNFEQIKYWLDVLDKKLANEQISMDCVSLGGMNIAYLVNANSKAGNVSELIKKALNLDNNRLFECRPTGDIDLLPIHPMLYMELMAKGYNVQTGGCRIELVDSRGNIFYVDILDNMTNSKIQDYFLSEYNTFPKIFSGDNLVVHAPPAGEVYVDKCLLGKTSEKHGIDKEILEKVVSKKVLNAAKRMHNLE